MVNSEMKIENNLLERNMRVYLLFLYGISWKLTEEENSCCKQERMKSNHRQNICGKVRTPQEKREANKQHTRGRMAIRLKICTVQKERKTNL
jgi:hypothetical protein